jgi:hypothetical protein
MRIPPADAPRWYAVAVGLPGPELGRRVHAIIGIDKTRNTQAKILQTFTMMA